MIVWDTSLIALLSILVLLALIWIVSALRGHRLEVEREQADTVPPTARRLRFLRIPGFAHWSGPLMLLAAGLAVRAFLPLLEVDEALAEGIGHGVMLCLIGASGWLLVRVLRAVTATFLGRYDVSVGDNLNARRMHTQISVIQRILTFVIVLVTVGVMLMTFQRVSEIGVSILASAGLAGVVIGFAAQKSIASVLAGIQIALTQPIRIDDVLIVEGEWGRVEEITLTYVVIRIWDQRRLVVPIGYFIEQPFQNWTRTSAEILGTVFVYVDYTVPVEVVRKALGEILATAPGFDGRAWCLQVTDARPGVLELRALMSAPDAGLAWELRCHVREKLVAFIQSTYPQVLPRTRVVLEREREASTDSAAPPAA